MLETLFWTTMLVISSEGKTRCWCRKLYIYIYIYCEKLLQRIPLLCFEVHTYTSLSSGFNNINDYNIPFRKCQCHSNIGRLQSKATQNPIFIIIKVIIFCPNKMCFVAIHSFHAFKFYFSFFMQLKKCTVLL